MSLLRIFVTKSMMDPFRTSHIIEQHLANTMARIFTPIESQMHRQWWNEEDGANPDQFKMNLNVQEFKPEEISIKVTSDQQITIEGKHEEKEDGKGFISRHFIRRYVIPDNYDMKKIVSNLSSDGILTITAPNLRSEFVGQKEIPINQTGEPAIEQSKEQKE